MINTQAIRNKVLDLAISGGMTPHPNNDSGEELLIAIIKEKERIKQNKKQNNGEATLPPFTLPRGWAWAQLEKLCDDVPNAFADGPFGSNLKKEHYTNDKQVRIIQLSNVGVNEWRNDNEKYTTFEHLETIKRSEVKAGDIVIAKMMPAGRAVIVPEGIAPAFVLSSDCVKFVPHPSLNTEYLCCAINSIWFHDQVLKDVHGIGRERTSLSKLKKYYIPLPSASEQQEIVDRLKEIFSLLDTIDELQIQYASNLSVLKSKLVDLSVQGKLTKQLPEDGNAEEIFKQMQLQKEKLIREKKIKKEKDLSQIKIEDVPYKIPDNWKWVRVGDVGSWAAGSTPSRKRLDYYKNGTIPWLKTGDLNDGFISEVPEKITETALKESTLRINPIGSVLMAMYGATIGKLGILEVPMTTNQACCACIPFVGLYNRYLFYYLLSARTNYIEKGKGGAQPNISKEIIINSLIPLPPLPEQKRIVEKLDNIFAVVDKVS